MIQLVDDFLSKNIADIFPSDFFPYSKQCATIKSISIVDDGIEERKK